MLRDGETTVEIVGQALGLSREEVRFAELYHSEFAGDGLRTAADIWGFNLSIKAQHIRARTIATRLLNDADIMLLVNSQLNALSLNDTHVNAVLAGLVSQGEDKRIQMAAIKHYADISDQKRRNEEEGKQQLFDYTRLSDEQLRQLASILQYARIDTGEQHPFPIMETLNNEVIADVEPLLD